MANEPVLSESEILDLITEKERSKKYVWTAGRVLMASGLVGDWQELDSANKKSLLKDMSKMLEKLEDKGVLLRRDIPQSIGFGNEIGFDFIPEGTPSNKPIVSR